MLLSSIGPVKSSNAPMNGTEDEVDEEESPSDLATHDSSTCYLGIKCGRCLPRGAVLSPGSSCRIGSNSSSIAMGIRRRLRRASNVKRKRKMATTTMMMMTVAAMTSPTLRSLLSARFFVPNVALTGLGSSKRRLISAWATENSTTTAFVLLILYCKVSNRTIQFGYASGPTNYPPRLLSTAEDVVDMNGIQNRNIYTINSLTACQKPSQFGSSSAGTSNSCKFFCSPRWLRLH
jgi:hypothetical protein